MLPSPLSRLELLFELRTVPSPNELNPDQVLPVFLLTTAAGIDDEYPDQLTTGFSACTDIDGDILFVKPEPDDTTVLS